MAQAPTPTDTSRSLSNSAEGSVMLLFVIGALVAALGVGADRLTRKPAGGDEAHAAGAATDGQPAAHAHPVAQHQAGPVQVAQGPGGAVATAAPEASRAGLAVLAKGGNAFDAFVTASFVVSVVRPQSTGLGGGGFTVFHRADGVSGAIDGRERAPRAATREMYMDAEGELVPRSSLDGPLAAGTPGLVRMLWDLWQRNRSGNLEWGELLEPAIDYAEKGCVVRGPLARSIAHRRELLARFPSSAQVFMPGGRPLQEGDVLIQRDLAKTLRRIAEEGVDGFYSGLVAVGIADGCRQFGGLITELDLESYRTARRSPVVGEYRGHTVISMPPPSSGGVHLVQMLNIMSGYDLRGMGFQSADHLHVLTEAMRRAYADRSKHLGDPDFVEVPVEWLTSAEYAAELRAGIDMERSTPSSEVDPGQPPAEEGDQTTHLSVIDAEGNAVSSTQTINTGLGSGFVVPGYGILLNNEMDDFAAKPGGVNYFGVVQGEANAVAPLKRPLSSMTPTIVLDPQGDVRLIVGSPGGTRIITTVLQVLSNVVDFGFDLEQAVAAPRIHHQWKAGNDSFGPDILWVEAETPQDSVADLAGRGQRVRVLERTLGNVQAILVGPDGQRTAVADPRATGGAAAN